MRKKKEFIPKKDLVHGEYYYGDCRNSDTARWNADMNRFFYNRTKFTMKFVEDINHPEDDNGFDLFYPYKLIDYDVPEIKFPNK
jgi:hypothetical protein